MAAKPAYFVMLNPLTYERSIIDVIGEVPIHGTHKHLDVHVQR